MKKILSICTNGRVISAVVSALGAIISALCAGCRLYCSEFSLEIDTPNYHSITNKVN